MLAHPAFQCSLGVPELPRWHRTRISPQPSPPCPRLFFRESIALPIFFRLLIFVLLVVPRQANGDQRKTGVQGLRAVRLHCGASVRSGNHHLTDDAAVAIMLSVLN